MVCYELTPSAVTDNGVDSIVEELQRLLIHLPKVNFNIVKYLMCVVFLSVFQKSTSIL